MEIKILLKNLGWSDKEVSVFLALVEIGHASVREVALKSKVNRGTTYDILKNLIQQGVVAYFHKETKQYFVAEHPEKLLRVVEQKQESLQKLSKQITATLPVLKSIYEKQGGKPTVMLYEGVKGVKTILQDVLDSLQKNESYFVYSASDVRGSVHEAMPDFSKKRVKKGIKVKTIALGKGGILNGLDERKWMQVLESKDSQEVSTYELIYSNKVAHISLDVNGNPMGVVINNPSIFLTQKKIFEFNWKNL